METPYFTQIIFSPTPNTMNLNTLKTLLVLSAEALVQRKRQQAKIRSGADFHLKISGVIPKIITGLTHQLPILRSRFTADMAKLITL